MSNPILERLKAKQLDTDTCYEIMNHCEQEMVRCDNDEISYNDLVNSVVHFNNIHKDKLSPESRKFIDEFNCPQKLSENLREYLGLDIDEDDL